MPFTIVRKNDADEHSIIPRVLPRDITTLQQAIAALERDLEAYPERGRDDEQYQWWARNGYGQRYSFWIDGH
jgi:hypothetical protein